MLVITVDPFGSLTFHAFDEKGQPAQVVIKFPPRRKTKVAIDAPKSIRVDRSE
jgi:hypothetical protein